MWTASLHLRLCPPNCRRHSSSSATITTYRRRSRRVAGVSRVAKILHRRPTRKRQWRSIVKSAVHQGKGQISFYNNRSPSPNCIFAFYFEPILRAYPPPSSSRHIFIYFVFFLLLSLPPNHRGHNATLSPLTKWSVALIHFLNQFDEIVGTEKKSTSLHVQPNLGRKITFRCCFSQFKTSATWKKKGRWGRRIPATNLLSVFCCAPLSCSSRVIR